MTVCFFGEGAVAEGEFHESLNLAALWQLPVLFCCENNLYAMGTALAREHAQTDLALRAASYGMAAWAVDGMDVRRRRGRGPTAPSRRSAHGGGPHFLELRTYRFRAHSMYDPERYRDKAEVAEWKDARPDRPRSSERMQADGPADRPAAGRAGGGGRRRGRRRGGGRRAGAARAGRGADPLRLRDRLPAEVTR